MSRLIYNPSTGNLISRGGDLLSGTTASCACWDCPPVWPPCRTQGSRELFYGTETTTMVAEDIRVGGVSTRYLNGVVIGSPFTFKYFKAFDIAFVLKPIVTISYTFSTEFISYVAHPDQYRSISFSTRLDPNEGAAIPFGFCSMTQVRRELDGLSFIDRGVPYLGNGELYAKFSNWIPSSVLPDSLGAVYWNRQDLRPVTSTTFAYQTAAASDANRYCVESVYLDYGIGIIYSSVTGPSGVGDHHLKGTVSVTLSVNYP